MAALPGDHGKWVQIPRGAATVSGECCFLAGSLTPPPLCTSGHGKARKQHVDPPARISGAGPSFTLGARHAEKEPRAYAVRSPALPCRTRSSLQLHVQHGRALLCGTGDRTGRRSRWPRRCRRGRAPDRRHVGRRAHADRVVGTVHAQRSRQRRLRSPRRDRRVPRQAGRGDRRGCRAGPRHHRARNQRRVRVGRGLGRAGRDSAVGGLVERHGHHAGRSREAPGRERGRRAARGARTVGRGQRRARGGDERLSARRRIGLLARVRRRRAGQRVRRRLRLRAPAGRQHRADRNRPRTAERAVWIERHRLGRPDHHAAERAARRVGVARGRRIRYLPRDGRDVGHGRQLALGRGHGTADDGQLQRPAHRRPGRSSRTTTTSGARRPRLAAGGTARARRCRATCNTRPTSADRQGPSDRIQAARTAGSTRSRAASTTGG